MIRLIHADDHPVVRTGISLVLNQTGEFDVVAQASDGKEALELIRKHSPEVALVDFSMPGLDGLEVTRKVAKTPSIKTSVIVLSVHEHRHYALRALQAGAKGYMHKAAAPNAICEAIRKVASGLRAMPLHLRDLENAEIEPVDATAVWELSKREQQVFYLLAECNTSHEAAKDLGVSVKTVDSHRGQILKKLGLRGNAELTRFAIKNGFIPA